jgi:L-cysteine S-thiosulfotransferase
MKVVRILLLMAAALIVGPLLAETPVLTDLERGKAIAFDRNAGNCLACHAIDDGELPGNSGPPLLQMPLRFPDREVLRSQIWDATVRNPNTVMPPYGKHMILTNEEIDLVVDYLLTL